MITITNTALDGSRLKRILLLLQLKTLGILLLLGLIPNPGVQLDILADSCRIILRTRAVLGRQTELGPLTALGYAGVYFAGDGGSLDDTDVAGFFALGVEAVGNVLFGAVCVFDNLGLGEGFGGVGVVVVFGPVCAAVEGVSIV